MALAVDKDGQRREIFEICSIDKADMGLQGMEQVRRSGEQSRLAWRQRQTLCGCYMAMDFRGDAHMVVLI